jgi:hypothetical protein
MRNSGEFRMNSSGHEIDTLTYTTSPQLATSNNAFPPRFAARAANFVDRLSGGWRELPCCLIFALWRGGMIARNRSL